MKYSILLLLSFSQLALANVYSPVDVWPSEKASLTLCFFNPDKPTSITRANAVNPNQDLKNAVKSALLSAYQFDSAGVEVKGLEDCQDGVKQDAIIYFNPGSGIGEGHAEVLGKTSADLVSQGLMFVKIGVSSKTEFSNFEIRKTQATTLHEVGHLFGLSHEHQYFVNDAEFDPNCHIKQGNISTWEFLKYLRDVATPRTSRTYNEVYNVGVVEFSPYDNKSIMNYCYLETAPLPELSEGDKEILRHLYRK